MGVGQLSSEQSRYNTRLYLGASLDPIVSRSWIGLESGWNATKPGHNYLNIGPGRTYGSVDEAARAAVNLIRDSALYREIRGAGNARAELDAIVRSPWEEHHYGMTVGPDGRITSRLHEVYDQVLGVTAGGTVSPDEELIPGMGGPPVEELLPDLGASVAGLLGLSGLNEEILVLVLTVVFAAAALGLLGLGIYRLAEPTGIPQLLAEKGAA